jgi:hypothetical protein
MTRKDPALGEDGSGVVPARHVRLGGEATPIPACRAGTETEPQVQLIREGDVIVAIDLTCSCGRRVRLCCVY